MYSQIVLLDGEERARGGSTVGIFLSMAGDGTFGNGCRDYADADPRIVNISGCL